MATPKFTTGINLDNKRAQAMASPSTGTDGANKDYVDNVVNGLQWKAPVRVATTAAGTLASTFENGDVIDGVTLATGNRILIKDQAAGAENGIYTVNASGAPTRATDFDASSEVLANATVYVNEGTVNADKAFTLTNNGAIVLGTTALVFAQTGGGGTTYSADGNGIELTSTTFSLELDGTTLSKSATGLRIGSGAAGAGLVEATGVLAVGAGTGMTVNADDVAINTSVVARKFAAACVATTNPQTFAHGFGHADVDVTVKEGNNVVYPDVTVDATNITVDWGSAPTVGQYRVIARG